ncbi:MAG: class I SAM-dependent methyltransferase [Hydrogenophaga sp.]|uniref:class I SAM-dependent methyltransferase n=1 Tax=Hydrogenophaga sp. TaxID=1904254 RepID=UPI0016A1BE4E|nr:class I SAM-dependent methyltransferase [Hydrogenophaga sp.]NIM42401.1 class I SAM-dependent methyltransferase [Hydrogenophaga sp.]NIN27556.1 class I SAM-dependent methyltransferase [Hydrogenophaga sp.]NIN32375.1 class I SAM-dependent methyltransferase [Hydrogenophaga sp.]NIN56609.1 class I SAM-dependent methyltransferase [Hydrogenophaga sp.]NIO52972.1 class I SAM-dependent methyltransferase [Hydrogenophaga sp.]
MSTAEAFDADWLALRGPFDAAARDGSSRLVARLRTLRPGQGPWRVMDLGCGTGANWRWLAPRLGGEQHWLALDHDAALLRAWPLPADAASSLDAPLRWRGRGFDATLLRREAELARGLPSLPWAAVQLVTASALLDLAGADWLGDLVRHASEARATLFFALNVDGGHTWSPADADDAWIGGLFAAHQGRDKGLGPALGARAVPWLAQALRARGYRVALGRSDWRVGPGDQAMTTAMIEGFARAAIEQEPTQAPRVRAWRARRLRAIDSSRLRVGHLDLLAWPAR